MIIVMKAGASKREKGDVIDRIKELGYKPHVIHGTTRDVIGAVGDERGKQLVIETIESMQGVESVVPILKAYKLASRELRKESSIIKITDSLSIGGSRIVVMAGPCAVENEKQIIDTATAVRKAGANVLRGGAFKPRTSPYSFQGMKERGLKLLAKARKATGLPVITEVVNPETAELVAEYADILQIGTRNAQNFELLKKVGQIRRPVMLKRGMSMTIKELLMSAEYIMSEGNQSVILCERGIRTFETATRNTLDLSAIPVLKNETHLPIVADPSHGTGHQKYVAAMAFAAVAAGADGLMIEVHPDPEHATSDGPQSLTPKDFSDLMSRLKLFAEAAGRTL
ncbi:MAG TPA: 3-deoxy-7-phosphoheptulonate synthase [Dissulfurispiraceae bacterium]|nr:3-deoxy-7-phosphoheptulonate synthase [Dissulfurispiraceae bacterium]